MRQFQPASVARSISYSRRDGKETRSPDQRPARGNRTGHLTRLHDLWRQTTTALDVECEKVEAFDFATDKCQSLLAITNRLVRMRNKVALETIEDTASMVQWLMEDGLEDHLEETAYLSSLRRLRDSLVELSEAGDKAESATP